jgi:serine/threonine protein phosphatase PrpC
MELRGATATHVGNVRESNQDRGHFGGYVAVVADGMGGHQGGETAAAIAISEFVGLTTPIGASGLVELVEDANRAVFEKAAEPDLRGMGTTLVALTLRPNEAKVGVVNVGDSRAYFLRGDELGRLTYDHSLVEDLVRQKRLTPEEALHHPQRNILTRALGISSHVEVDQFVLPTKVGDRFLLCSDGLFNEVSEEEIQQLLQTHADPGAAAEALVTAALAGAGRDNITVVVVDVVDDGHGGAPGSTSPDATVLAPAVITGPIPAPDGGQSQPVPAAAGGVLVSEAHEPEVSDPPDAGFDPNHTAFHASPAPAPAKGAVTLQVHTEPVEEDEGRFDESTATAEYPAVYETFEPEPVRGRRAMGLVAVGVLLGALVAGVVLGARWYNRSIWFVEATDAGQVAIFNGRPGGLLWVDPVQQQLPGPLLDELVPDDRALVADRPTFGSRADAERFLASLTEEAELFEDAADPLEDINSTTKTSTTTTSTASTVVGGAAAPGAATPGDTAPLSTSGTAPATPPTTAAS